MAFVKNKGVDDATAVAHAPDLFLACACLAHDPRALSILERVVLIEVPSFVAKVEREPSEVAEIQQAVREKLLMSDGDHAPRLAEYAGRGSLGAFVRIIAVRIALDRKRRQARSPGSDELGDLGGVADPELDYLREKYREQFVTALRGALAGLEPRARTVLRMNMLDGLSIDRIASTYEVHRATAARWVVDARADVLAATKHQLGANLQLRADELESLVRLVGVDLDVSVRRLLSE